MTTHRKHAEHSGDAQKPATDAAGCAPPDAIAHRAYELFQERGREPGRDLEDWLRAEQELKPSRHDGQSE